MKHIIESQQFNKKFIDAVFASADKFQKKAGSLLRGKILASLFYEPSTRTRFSFESAMLRLGGSVIATENASEFSSAAKGETLEDSIRVVQNYADVIVLRHYEEGASARAAAVSKVPVINAGDGVGQHPTQALLDLYTIKREIGRLERIALAFVGDLKHGRTVRSLAYLLGKYKNVTVFFVSPKSLRVGDDIKEYLQKHKVVFEEREDLVSIVSNIDVLYVTRIQKERFKNKRSYAKVKGSYTIDSKIIERMKAKAIVMHPLPRVNEISPDVDASPKAVYFKQARYGMYVRMALLIHLLK